MILEEETFKKFGYHPKDLSLHSGRKILSKCDKCGKIREVESRYYRDLCHPCSLKSESFRKKISEIRITRGLAKGKNNPSYGRKGKLAPMYGKSESQSPTWKGGTSFEPYCIKFNNDFKERVRNYFNRCCYVCGKNEIENKQKLDIHHVTYNKDTCCDDSKPLFVPLCRSCHIKTNFDRDYWQEFFTVSLEYLTDGECYIKK